MNTARKLLLSILATTAFVGSSAYACDTHGIYFSHHYSEDARNKLPAPEDRPDHFFLGDITVSKKRSRFFAKPAVVQELHAFVHDSETHPGLVGKHINITSGDLSTCNPGFIPGERITASANFVDVVAFGLKPPILVAHSHTYEWTDE